MADKTVKKEETFEDLVDEATRCALNLFITEGGKGLKRAIYMYMFTATKFNEENRK
jgi:hypothetical protein